jgi:hypothetical protein
MVAMLIVDNPYNCNKDALSEGGCGDTIFISS